jgi:hypothetical protein
MSSFILQEEKNQLKKFGNKTFTLSLVDFEHIYCVAICIHIFVIDDYPNKVNGMSITLQDWQ